MITHVAEHVDEIGRWEENKLTRDELLEVTVVDKACVGDRTVHLLLVTIFDFTLNQGLDRLSLPIDVSLLLLFLVLKTVALEHQADLPLGLLKNLCEPVHTPFEHLLVFGLVDEYRDLCDLFLEVVEGLTVQNSSTQCSNHFFDGL